MRKNFRQPPRSGELKDVGRGMYVAGSHKHIPGIEGHIQTRADQGPDEIAAWFLGTKAENGEVFSRLVQEAIEAMVSYRRFFHPEDPSHVTERVKNSAGYHSGIQSLTDNFWRLLAFINEYATPFFSMRYQGHMLWDTTMPAMLGYFATMLHNPNNVSVQASTATTYLELLVARDLCKMIGFDSKVEPWAHITCDGTVANMEALWSARELKFLPLAVKKALTEEYRQAADIEICLPDGSRSTLARLDPWQLLNVRADDALQLPAMIAECCDLDQAEVWQTLAENYSVNALGMVQADKCYLQQTGTPLVLAPSTRHYSWVKAAAMLGLGRARSGIREVWVDANARMKIDDLSKVLDDCVERRVPVAMCVAVLGSTEESAVDPLSDILQLREEYRRRYNIDFHTHADAAWGGYQISVIRNDYDLQWPQAASTAPAADEEPFITDTSGVPLSDYVIKQLKQVRHCDSVTVDPHKSGYVPYPAGTIVYRNRDMTNLVTFGAPYIGRLEEEVSVGQFGIEGSKPGASAAAVFLSHSVIRPSIKGYGKLLTRSLINTKLFYLYLLLMRQPEDRFFVVLVPGPPAEDEFAEPWPSAELLRQAIRGKSGATIIENETLRFLLKNVGPDLNILDYVFNFYRHDGSVNSDLEKVNQLNQTIYERLHVLPGTGIRQYDLLVTKSTFYRRDYGDEFMNALAERLRLARPREAEMIHSLRSVVMDPWPAETEVEGSQLNFFEAIIIPTLREVVCECVEALDPVGEDTGQL